MIFLPPLFNTHAIINWAPYACIKPVSHTSVFPHELKVAKVIPLFKSNDSMVFSNYKPVSIPLFFQKFWTPYVQPFVIVCKQMSITISVSIQVPLRSFTWTGAHVSSLECLREWRVYPWIFSRLLQGIWYSTSWHFVRKIRISRHPWYSTDVV